MAAPSPTIASKPLILCVEDNEIYLRPRKTVLEQAGYAVLSASTGTEATEILGCSCLSRPVRSHAAGNNWHFSCEADEENQARCADHPVLGEATENHAECGRLHQQG